MSPEPAPVPLGDSGLSAGPETGIGPGPSPALFRSYAFLLTLAALTTAADLGSKLWATRTLGASGSSGMIKVVDHFNLVLAHNKGGAGSFLSTAPDAFRLPFFVAVGVGAIAAMLLLYRKLTPSQWALRWGLPLVLGGALGNLVDRVRFGSVVDFLQVYARIGGQIRYWPTFNVADIAICVGVGLMAIDLFQQTRGSLPAVPPPAAPDNQPTAG